MVEPGRLADRSTDAGRAGPPLTAAVQWADHAVRCSTLNLSELATLRDAA